MLGMTQNFVACDRDQELLLPPNLRDWLPEDHLALFVVDAVEAMELAALSSCKQMISASRGSKSWMMASSL